MKNGSMPNFTILPSISDEILTRFCCDNLIQILIKIGSVPNVKNQAIFRRICMELLEHNCGNILPTICTNMLIFIKDTIGGKFTSSWATASLKTVITVTLRRGLVTSVFRKEKIQVKASLHRY